MDYALAVQVPAEFGSCALDGQHANPGANDAQVTITSASLCGDAVTVNLVGTLPEILYWVTEHHFDALAAWEAVDKAITASFGSQPDLVPQTPLTSGIQVNIPDRLVQDIIAGKHSEPNEHHVVVTCVELDNNYLIDVKGDERGLRAWAAEHGATITEG